MASKRHTEFAPFILDLIDFMKEKLREAVADEASQAGAVSEASDGKDQEYIFKGISGRAFERKFSLADYVEVERASCDNGLLQIDLVRRIPDPMKPRAIAIEAGTPASNVASLKAA